MRVTGPDGVRLYYERIGTGGPTLIVPGRLFLARDLAPLGRRHILILYDMRNRGRSSRVEDGALLTMQKDMEDLEAVGRHFGVERFVPVGCCYLGFMVVLYAMEHPDRVERLVQLGPVPRKFGTVGRPERASRLMSQCEMENEWPANLTRHFEHHFGAVQRMDVPREAVAHGTWDRNAPYASGREWAMTLPDARLITVDGAAHQVTADAPEVVLGAIEEFVAGRWPRNAERVTRLER